MFPVEAFEATLTKAVEILDELSIRFHLTGGITSILYGEPRLNSHVDKLVDSGLLKRVLAQTEIRYSNSLIEAWWRVMKHQWLFLNTLDTLASVRKLVAFYVTQHNSHLPHSAFDGQTPDEMYFGTGVGVPKKLEAAALQAREMRLKANRSRTCHVCRQSASAS